jgi:hypothetical protein
VEGKVLTPSYRPACSCFMDSKEVRDKGEIMGRLTTRTAHHPSIHMQVKKINYAGLPGHPGHAVHMRQATSGGSLLSFETGSLEASKVGHQGAAGREPFIHSAVT